MQKYIARPFLIDGYKHTLRLYVLITSISPLRLYLHKNGIIKFASEQFQTSLDFHNNDYSHMHITHPLDITLDDDTPVRPNIPEKPNIKCASSVTSLPFMRQTPDGKPFRWFVFHVYNFLGILKLIQIIY